MAIPHVFAPILKQDFTLRPFQVHKKHYIEYTQVQDSSSGYMIWDAYYDPKKIPIGTTQMSNYATNSFDGSYKANIWNWIDAQYYRYPYDAYASLEHTSPNWTYKFLNHSASIISIPYHDMGEKIKPGSFQLTCSVDNNIYKFSDDGYGNIYMPILDEPNYLSGERNLIFDMYPNRIFKQIGSKWKSQQIAGIESYRNIDEIGIPYRSYTGYDKKVIGKNLVFSEQWDSGETSTIFGNSMRSNITMPHSNEFNFPNGDFTILCRIRLSGINPPNDYEIQTIIEKRSVLTKNVFGNTEQVINDTSYTAQNYGTETIEDETPIYPYWLYVYTNGVTPELHFKRSNGIDTVHISASLFANNIEWNVGIIKSGSNISLVRANSVVETVSDVKGDCFNNYDISIGSTGVDSENYFRGNIDYIRMFDYGKPLFYNLSIDYSNSFPRNTIIVGNIFYKSGIVVINNVKPIYGSAIFLPDIPDPITKMHRLFDGQWYMQFRGTHTIYQYEILSRIKKGDFNLSQNPSAKQNYATDLLIDDMVTGSLYPYATSIGYYNDSGELMAVAKLNQSLQMRDDTDINIICRLDC